MLARAHSASTARHQLAADLHTMWHYLACERPSPGPADVIFAFGSTNLGVARTAARLYVEGAAPWVVVTGGVSRPGALPEAEQYAAILHALGVPADRVIVEREATNTGENVAFGMRAAAARGVAVRTAALVAFPSSLRRSAATFAWQFPSVTTSAHGAFRDLVTFDAPVSHIASTLAAEVDRLEQYPALGYIGDHQVPASVRHARDRVRTPAPDLPAIVGTGALP